MAAPAPGCPLVLPIAPPTAAPPRAPIPAPFSRAVRGPPAQPAATIAVRPTATIQVEKLCLLLFMFAPFVLLERSMRIATRATQVPPIRKRLTHWFSLHHAQSGRKAPQ